MNLAVETALSHLERVSKPYAGERGHRQIKARCPFHDDNRPSFGVNLDTGDWNCLAGCGGGWVDTLLYRLGYSKEQVKQLTKGLGRPERPSRLRQHVLEQRHREAGVVLPEEVLDVFYGCPIDMLDDGWPEEALFKFEIGWDHGQERITYPIRDMWSKLVAVSGRTVYGNAWPKYKFYGEEDLYDLAPVGYRPQRANLVYNVHRAVLSARRGELVPVCEGFKEVMRLEMAGITGVSLTGAMFSRKQIRVLNTLVFRTGCTLVVMLDDDKAGREQAPKLCKRLSRFTMPRIAFTEDVKDISEVEDLNQVRRVVRGSSTYLDWTLREN